MANHPYITKRIDDLQHYLSKRNPESPEFRAMQRELERLLADDAAYAPAQAAAAGNTPLSNRPATGPTTRAEKLRSVIAGNKKSRVYDSRPVAALDEQLAKEQRLAQALKAKASAGTLTPAEFDELEAMKAKYGAQDAIWKADGERYRMAQADAAMGDAASKRAAKQAQNEAAKKAAAAAEDAAVQKFYPGAGSKAAVPSGEFAAEELMGLEATGTGAKAVNLTKPLSMGSKVLRGLGWAGAAYTAYDAARGLYGIVHGDNAEAGRDAALEGLGASMEIGDYSPSHTDVLRRQADVEERLAGRQVGLPPDLEALLFKNKEQLAMLMPPPMPAFEDVLHAIGAR